MKQYLRLRADGVRLTPQMVLDAPARVRTRLAPLDVCALP